MSELLVRRDMSPEERNMVLSDWKKDLSDRRPPWGVRLRADEWWALVNYTVDQITLPSSRVHIGVHKNHPEVPLCWASVRDSQVLHLHARSSIHQSTPVLLAHLQRELLGEMEWDPDLFNPFKELARASRARTSQC